MTLYDRCTVGISGFDLFDSKIQEFAGTAV